MSFQQAPMLAERTGAGELPPVEERLPKSPAVLEPVTRVGSYGGEWNMIYDWTAGAAAMLLTTIGWEHLVRWRPDTRNYTQDEIIPNLAETWEINDNGREYVFHLREGIKWSDGEPFGADDILFWYEDVLMNDELTPSHGSQTFNPDNPVTVDKVDDYTISFSFPRPHGLLLQKLAVPPGQDVVYYPAHYMKQFHKKYNPQADQDAKRQGMGSWVDLFVDKAAIWTWANTDKPQLHGWILTSAPGEDPQRVVAERNPYYWKVDVEGHQLPYLDRVVITTGDPEIALIKAANGEVDMQTSYFTDLKNKPILARDREKGSYRFVDLTPSKDNYCVIALNLTHQDTNLRQVFQNKDFRIGLSHAINRQEIIDAVFQRQGEPFQVAPRPESAFYNEQLAKQYIEYDIDKANEHLERVLPNKDGDGFRLGADGERLVFQVEVSSGGESALFPDVLELVRNQWRTVGVDMRIKVESRELLYTRKAASQHDAVVWSGAGGLNIILEPRNLFPFKNETNWAIPWALWYLNPNSEQAQEPPEPGKQQMQLYRQLEETADPDQQAELLSEIIDIAADQFWCIGIALPTQAYGIVKNTFHSVPNRMVSDWFYPTPAPTNPQQYFTEE